jgi:hypothetical protein
MKLEKAFMGFFKRLFNQKSKTGAQSAAKIFLDPKVAVEQEKSFLVDYSQSEVAKQKTMALVLMKVSNFYLNSDRATGV